MLEKMTGRGCADQEVEKVTDGRFCFSEDGLHLRPNDAINLS